MDPSDDRRAIFRDASGQDTVLVPGETLRLGRHVDNDIVINDTTASRFHATVRWDPELERPVLYDNGSANGTVVNGTEVHNATHPVGQHAVIEISGHRLDVRLENCGETPAILKNAGDMVTLFSDQGPEIKGTIGTDASIRELLQRLEAERRTGTLVLSSSGAKVTVCLGKLMQANVGKFTGRNALNKIYESAAGLYAFSRELEPVEGGLDMWFSDYLRERKQAQKRRLDGTETRIHKRRALMAAAEDEDDEPPR